MAGEKHAPTYNRETVEVEVSPASEPLKRAVDLGLNKSLGRRESVLG